MGLKVRQVALYSTTLWDLISILGEGARSFSSIKPSMTNPVNSSIADGKILFHVCMLTFLTFTWELSV